MSNQIVISSGAKVRNLSGVLTGTSGIVNSLGINVPDGIPQLDGSGKILVSQLPNSVMEYKGTWNAATNTPTLANGTGNAGDVYLCNVAGTTDFGAGPITFAVGDQVLYSGTTWEKASGATGTVTSVAVTESGDALTITGSPITTSGTINIGFAGTGSQYIKGDGTLATFPTTIDQAKRLITEVYNSTGATLTKGTVVYINGGQGNLPTITKAQANADNTSAQTYGVVQSDITNNNNGFVVVFGSLTDLDTQAYSVGTQLYLSGTTAGEWTSTKPSAPIHLVYVGIVVRSHPTQGVVEIRIQNGYELEELHDVAITSVANNDGIFYNSSNNLWENKTIDEALGYTPANDSLVVKLAGTQTITGSKTFNNAINAESGILLKNGFTAYSNSYTSLGGNIGNLIISGSISSTPFDNELAFTPSTSNIYEFPNLSGTLAMLEAGTQTFTGTVNVLGSLGTKYGISIEKGNTPSPLSANDVFIYASSGATNILNIANSSYNAILSFPSSNQTYTFPAATGTLALTSNLSSYVPYTGATANVVLDDYTLSGKSISYTGTAGSGFFKLNQQGQAAIPENGTVKLSIGTTSNLVISSNSYNSILSTSANTADRTYTFPDASGTLALTSDLSGYLPLTGGTLSGILNISTASYLTSRLKLNNTATGGNIWSISSGNANNSTNNGLFTIINETLSKNTFVLSPTGKLAIGADIGSTNPADDLGIFSTNTNLKIFDISGNGSALNLQATNSSAFISAAYFTTAIPLVLRTGNTDRLTIAANGAATFSGSLTATSLIVGSTPILYGNVAIKSNSSTSYFGLNVIANGNNNFIALNHTGSVGVIETEFSTGGSHTPIAFVTGGSERMRITSGGNIGIGNTSPATKLHITTAGADMSSTINYSTNTQGLIIDMTTGTSQYGAGVWFRQAGLTAGIGSTRVSSGDWATDLRFYTHPSSTTNSDTLYERMRITSEGNVGIGTSSPVGLLHLNSSGSTNFYIQSGAGNSAIMRYFIGTSEAVTTRSDSSGNYQIETGLGSPTERMRITSGGNVLIGTTTDISSNYKVQLTGAGGVLAKGTNSGDASFLSINQGSGFHFYGLTTTGVFYVSNNGDVRNANNSYGAISDISLKENITDATPKLADLLKVKVRNYNLIADENKEKQIGVIAQELEEIFPNMISEDKQMGTDETIKTVKYSVFVPMLIKAIQEQQAQIEELKAEIDELKNK